MNQCGPLDQGVTISFISRAVNLSDTLPIQATSSGHPQYWFLEGIVEARDRVTGANKGIGYAIVKDLCTKFDGAVYLTARDESRGKTAVSELQKLGLKPNFHQLDVSDINSINTFRDYLQNKYGGLDVLINNAAIAYKNSATEPFGEQAENTMRVNYFNLLDVCHSLFPLLRPHARVVNVSSSMGHLTKIPDQEIRNKFASSSLTEEKLSELVNQFIRLAKKDEHTKYGWPNSSYSVSKVAVSALTIIQQRAFDQDSREDLVVNSVHPGYVKTDMTSWGGHFTAERGAEALVYLALLGPNISSPKGSYVWHDKKIVDWVHGPTPEAF
uniref:carbonyl reductase (NADPH) n=1 Tax=Timema tahoe TaxID=61484 RepID=A0A7R9IJM8_9NEOP|nr:unnamed protein product [Timema tahoe]